MLQEELTTGPRTMQTLNAVILSLMTAFIVPLLVVIKCDTYTKAKMFVACISFNKQC